MSEQGGCCGGSQPAPQETMSQPEQGGGCCSAPDQQMPTPMPPSEHTHKGIQLTDTAGSKLKEILEKEKQGPETGLRLGVSGGGCSGLQYVMDFDTKRDDDEVFTNQPSGVRLFVDPRSLEYLHGSELDFQEGLMGSGFAVKNPNKTGGCGCGQSFQT